MVEEIKVNCHSSIRIENEITIYIDPFKIENEINDADIILITHSHFDHFSKEDIIKVKKSNTKIYVTKDLEEKAKNIGFNLENIVLVEPNNNYFVNDKIKINTIPAYNVTKKFHKKENGWVGYLINIKDEIYYIAGDTDITEENKNVKCDIALVPIGGTYTMNYKEAAELINIINPKVVIPIHYNSIVGSKKDEKKFVNLLNENIKCEIKLL